MLFLSSCAAINESILQTRTSGQIGCSPEQIAIRDDPFQPTWTAECEGRTFFCVLENERTSCAESIKHKSSAQRARPAS